MNKNNFPDLSAESKEMDANLAQEQLEFQIKNLNYFKVQLFSLQQKLSTLLLKTQTKTPNEKFSAYENFFQELKKVNLKGLDEIVNQLLQNSHDIKNYLENENKFSRFQSSKKIISARVLAIDEEPSLLKALQRMLEQQHIVTLSREGNAVLKLLTDRSHQFDVIIANLDLVEGGNSKFYDYLIANHPNLQHRVVFLTDNGDTALVKEFANKIGNPIVEKPFTRDELLQAVNQVVVKSLSNSVSC